MNRYFVRQQVCGYSFWGQPLTAETIGQGKTALLFSGDFGGDLRCEGILCRFLEDLRLCGKQDLAPVGKVGMGRLLMVRRAVFLPCPNPDASLIKSGGLSPDSPFYPRVMRLLGKMPQGQWTANGRGVDVGRNFDFSFANYKKGCVAESAPFGHCGFFPESEPESACFAALARKLSPRLFVHLTTGIGGLVCERNQRSLEHICACYGPFDLRSADLSSTPEGWIFSELGCAYLRIAVGQEDEERTYRLLRPLLFALMAY